MSKYNNKIFLLQIASVDLFKNYIGLLVYFTDNITIKLIAPVPIPVPASASTSQSVSASDFAGLQIISNNKSYTTHFIVKLNANGFEQFFCFCDKFEFTIDTKELFKILNNTTNKDNLFLYMNKNDNSKLIVEINNNSTKIINKIHLLEQSTQINFSNIQNINYDKEIFIPSNKLYKILRIMYRFNTEILNIKYTFDNKLIFTNHDLNNDIAIHYGQEENNINKNILDTETNESNIINESYTIENNLNFNNIWVFAKHKIFYDNISIKIKNNFPLCMCYSNNFFGSITVFHSFYQI